MGINYALLPNREWNQKQKHKKQPWSKVECFAFGVVIVRFAPRIKTARRSRRKTPDDKMISWKKAESNLPKRFCMVGTRHFRPRQMIDIQYDITIIGGREVSRPYRVWFFAEGERFLSFWRCHRPRKRAALVLWCG